MSTWKRFSVGNQRRKSMFAMDPAYEQEPVVSFPQRRAELDELGSVVAASQVSFADGRLQLVRL